MNKIEKIIEKNGVLVLDGAMGTYLQDKGYDVNDSLWSAKFLDKDPNVIKQIHKEYIKAGADCIITATYQASIEGFLQKGFSEEKAKELIKLSITIANEAVEEMQKELDKDRALVAVSIGAYGAYLADGSEYSGKYGISDEKLEEFHRRRLEIIFECDFDILACETIPTQKEAKILSKLIKEYKTKKDFLTWISFSAKDEKHISSGESIKELFLNLDNQNHIEYVGINCTAPQYINTLLKNIKQVTSKKIVVYPNIGYRYNPISKKWEDNKSSPEEFAKLALSWYQNGASIIGGCCQTSPREILEIRDVFDLEGFKEN